MKVTRGWNSSGTTNFEVEREQEARQRPGRRRERQRLELVGERVLAQRAGRVLVLADRAQHPAPGRALDAGEDEHQQDRQPPGDEEQGKLGGDVGPAEVDDELLDRSPRPSPAVVEAEDPLGAVGEVARVRARPAGSPPRRRSCDREVVGAQPQRRQADDQPEADRDRDRDRQASQKFHPVLGGEDRHRVGADRHEPDLAEVAGSR